MMNQKTTWGFWRHVAAGRVFLLLLLSWHSWQLSGQGIIWEKSIHIQAEELESICQTADGQILTGGNTTRFGTYIPGGFMFSRSVLIKFTPEGDSLWLKPLPVYGTVKKLIPASAGLIWAVCQVANPTPDPLLIFDFPAFFLLTGDSGILVKKQFPELHAFTIGDCYPTEDGGLVVFGSRSPSMHPLYEQDFYAFRIDGTGNMVWSRPYNPGPGSYYCEPGTVEPMASGNYLVSGSMGNRIVSFEIDPQTGEEINFRQWYQGIGPIPFDFTGVVQSTDSVCLVSASKWVYPGVFYLGSHNPDGTRNWGGEQPGGSFPPSPNSDGSCIMIYGVDEGTYLVKIQSDSTIAWKRNLSTQSQYPGRKVLFDILYGPDGSGYMAGYHSVTGQGRNFYIAHFSGIGQPFDPTGKRQPHLVRPDAGLYPNPVQSFFRFGKEFGRGEVHLFSADGRRVFSASGLVSGSEVDVSVLPPGMYSYRAVLDGRPYRGKLIKL